MIAGSAMSPSFKQLFNGSIIVSLLRCKKKGFEYLGNIALLGFGFITRCVVEGKTPDVIL